MALPTNPMSPDPLFPQRPEVSQPNTIDALKKRRRAIQQRIRKNKDALSNLTGRGMGNP